MRHTMLPPISVNTVRTVVEAISNSQTIPEHLLSSLLSRRHHFLSISPSDRRDYLSWQSQDQSRVLDLVNALPYPPGDIQYGVQYTSEGGEGDTFAHVCAGHPPDAAQQDNRDVLRLVFRWEDPGWKYHNAALMPFPRDSHPSVSAALHAIAPAGPATSAPGPASASVSTPGPLPHPQVKLIIDHVASNCMDQSDSDDDSYWNAYARTGDSPNSSVSSLPRRSRLDEDDKLAQQNEDAYWARYTTVQGQSVLCTPLSLRPLLTRSRHSRLDDPLPPPLPQARAPPTAIHQPHHAPRSAAVCGRSSLCPCARRAPREPLSPPAPR
jgi:hypothetical protein